MNSEIKKILNKQPAKLIFFGHEYSVVFDRSRLTKDENGKVKNWAESLPAHNIIIMAEDIPDDYIIPVLIHECIEIINWHFGLELPHQTISVFETALFSILEDNKLRQ